MKKVISILAIAVVSLNFVSCRQDDVTSDMDAPSVEATNNFKKGETPKQDSATANAAQRPEVDPDPPVRDGTRW